MAYFHDTIRDVLRQLLEARTMAEFDAAMQIIHSLTPSELSPTERSLLLSLLDDLQPAIGHFADRERANVFFRQAVEQVALNCIERGLGIPPATVN